MNYFNYPTVPIGGRNPYNCCASCGRSVPEINGELTRHLSDCTWRMEQELNLSSLRVDREVLTELVIWAYDHEEITQSRAAEILGIPLVEFRSCYFEWLKPKDL